jgi:hypothetical protein
MRVDGRFAGAVLVVGHSLCPMGVYLRYPLSSSPGSGSAEMPLWHLSYRGRSNDEQNSAGSLSPINHTPSRFRWPGRAWLQKS